jgi:hypothetical protein
MICSFCGRTFDEELARKQCNHCTSFVECGKAKCPYCGYENAKEPKSLKWLNKIRMKKK